MTPTGPDGLHLGPLGNVKDQLNIGIVVIVCSARNRHVMIGQPDVLCTTNEKNFATQVVQRKNGVIVLERAAASATPTFSEMFNYLTVNRT